MTRDRKSHRTYIREFKLEAIRLKDQSDRPSSEIAAWFGIRQNLLYIWKAQLEVGEREAFSTKRVRPLKEDQSDVTTLRQEHDHLGEAFEIL